GTIERGEEAVTCRVYFLAAEAAELCSNGLVVTLQEFAPGAVANFRGPRGRSNDVGEEDGGKHAVRFRPRLPSSGNVVEKRLQRREERFLIAKAGAEVPSG